MKKLLIKLAYYILFLYCKTWRMTFTNEVALSGRNAEGKRSVVVIWHDQLLPLIFSYYNRSIATIASQSKDGDLITMVLKKWGYEVARGSSSRGGLKAVIGIKKLMEKGHDAAVTVDGPKGPRHKVKTGAIYIAKTVNAAIVPIFMSCKRYKRFASWDRFILPAPFSKISVTMAEPFYVSDDMSDEVVEKERQELEKYMLELTNEHSADFI